jgi:hypothetical protein
MSTNTKYYNYKASEQVPIIQANQLGTLRATKILAGLAKAMQNNYLMDTYANYLSENYVITCEQHETQDMLDELSLAGYCLSSRHTIPELLDAPKLIVRIARVKLEFASHLRNPVADAATALFIIPYTVQP